MENTTIVYSDIKKYNLHNILKRKDKYNTKDEKTRHFVNECIRNNPDFVQFALKATNNVYINDIIDKLITFVIKCNDVYYNYELLYNL